MSNNKTELVFILDRSGSMAGLESDTIGGFNANLKNQQNVEGDANVTTALFDDRYELLHDGQPIREVRPMTSRDYQARGSTALLDAMGRTIEKMIQVQKNARPAQKADRVLFVIITDGLENASLKYSADRIREMVSIQQERYGWEFVFLGANIDAVRSASHLGIREDRTADFEPDSKGMDVNFKALDKVINDFRDSGKVSADWNANITEDYLKRSGRKRGEEPGED